MYEITGRVCADNRHSWDGVIRPCSRCGEPVMSDPGNLGLTPLCTVCVAEQRPTFPAELSEEASRPGVGFRSEGYQWYRGNVYPVEPDGDGGHVDGIRETERSQPFEADDDTLRERAEAMMDSECQGCGREDGCEWSETHSARLCPECLAANDAAL